MIVNAPIVIIDMDAMMKIGKQVWPWEVAVLQEKFGESMVRIQEVSEVEVKELPDAAEEYMRLQNAHGADSGDGGSNLPYVQMAYGRGKAAIAAFEKEIKASIKKPKIAKAKAKKSIPKVEEAEGDPLG
jgi:hypothetical protein